MWVAGHLVLCPDYFPNSNGPCCADVLEVTLGPVSIIKELVKYTEEMAQHFVLEIHSIACRARGGTTMDQAGKESWPLTWSVVSGNQRTCGVFDSWVEMCGPCVQKIQLVSM